MKKRLLSLLGVLALGVGTTQAQVILNENFDTGLGGFTSGSFSHSTSGNACGSGAAYDNIFFGGPYYLNKPVFTATGYDISISFDYKIVDYFTNTATTGDWGIKVLEHTIDGGSNWVQDTLIDMNNHTPANTCAMVNTVTTAVEVPNGSSVQWRFNMTYNNDD